MKKMKRGCDGSKREGEERAELEVDVVVGVFVLALADGTCGKVWDSVGSVTGWNWKGGSKASLEGKRDPGLPVHREGDRGSYSHAI